MDVQERAKVLLKELSLIEADEIIETQEKMKATQVCRIAAALAQVEAEVWEKAAVMVEQDCWGNSEGDTRGLSDDLIEHNRNQRSLALAIRQQAQRAKEGKG